MNIQVDYGNWIRKRTLLILGLATLAVGALLLVPAGTVYHVALWIVFAVFLLSFLLPLYAYISFSQNGGKQQERLYDCIVRTLGFDLSGKYLDVGAGNGVLAIKIAVQNPKAEVLAIDYWGPEWEYSKGRCEQNARIAKVADRVRFQYGDAASLEFPSESFDGAVSNLTFHEVRSVPDKRAVLREALRVVKPGGAFAFVDYFLEPKYYGAFASFRRHITDLGLSKVEISPLTEVLPMPRLLRHPRMLGKVAILYGRK